MQGLPQVLPSTCKGKQLAAHAVLADRPPTFWHRQRFDDWPIAHFVGVAGGAHGFVFAFGTVVIDVRLDRALTTVVDIFQVVHHPHAFVVMHFDNRCGVDIHRGHFVLRDGHPHGVRHIGTHQQSNTKEFFQIHVSAT